MSCSMANWIEGGGGGKAVVWWSDRGYEGGEGGGGGGTEWDGMGRDGTGWDGMGWRLKGWRGGSVIISQSKYRISLVLAWLGALVLHMMGWLLTLRYSGLF